MSGPASVLTASWKSPRALALLVALWGLTFAGIQHAPLEKHESFVLATAREMETSGDWLLPRYNEELRLQKPPLSYWATLLVAAADPVNAEIRIWHGRLVSLLAALLMVLLTAKTGETAYGKEAGLLAALFLLSTNGMLNYVHSARPDMLYAAFCTLQLFAWIDAWKAESPSRQLLAAWLGWAAAGLATLTKGPQAPALFLLGTLLFLLTGPDRRRALIILRPFSGMAVFCLLVLPWWLLFQHRLSTLGVTLAGSQLSGSLLLQAAGWKDLLKVFYPWQSFAQMFPASLLLLGIVPGLVKARRPMQPVTRLLIAVSLLYLVVFSFGGQYRKHYLLPLLPLYSLLLAGHLDAIRLRGLSRNWRLALAAFGAAGALACAALMVWAGAFIMLTVYAALGFALARLLRTEPGATAGGPSALARLLLPVTSAVILAGAVYAAYSPQMLPQMEEQAFLQSLGADLAPNARLVCWKTSLDTLPYYYRKPVAKLTSPEDLAVLLAGSQKDSPVYAVLTARELPAFSERFTNRVVGTAAGPRRHKTRLCLCEVLGEKN